MVVSGVLSKCTRKGRVSCSARIHTNTRMRKKEGRKKKKKRETKKEEVNGNSEPSHWGKANLSR